MTRERAEEIIAFAAGLLVLLGGVFLRVFGH